MFRRFVFAAATVAALGTAALAASTGPAAAWDGWHGRDHHHHHWRGHWRGYPDWRGGHRFHHPGYHAHGGCHVRRVVDTPWGPRVRWINLCY